jgi:hypothetical protein
MKYGNEEKINKFQDIILKKKDNVIFVDLVLQSIIKAIDKWYDKHYQNDYRNLTKKSHLFHATRLYDYKRFKNCKNIGEERDLFLEEVNSYVQLKKEE